MNSTHKTHLTLSWEKKMKNNISIFQLNLFWYYHPSTGLWLWFSPLSVESWRGTLSQRIKTLLLVNTETIVHEKSMWGALIGLFYWFFIDSDHSIYQWMQEGSQKHREAPWVYNSTDGLLKRKCVKCPLTSMCPLLQGLSSGKRKLSAPSDIQQKDATSPWKKKLKLWEKSP